MGLGTIPSRTNGQTIDASWYNIIRTALGGDVVPRNTSGVVVDQAGSLGSTTYAWLYTYLTQLKLLSNANYVSFKAPAGLAANYDLITPAALPTASRGISFLTVDDAGQMALADAAGVMVMFGGGTAPVGWMECDGTSLLRADYPDLFTAIGTKWGAADGTHFNIPDMRGVFPRGYNHGKGSGHYDNDAGSRTASATGGATGDNVGSYQPNQNKAHTHTALGNYNGLQPAGAGSGLQALEGGAFTNTTSSNGGTQSQPENVSVMFIIKY